MQRRTSQTFQRIRKLSDTIIQVVVPTVAGSIAKTGPEDSFFEYGKKGWHAPRPPLEPAIHRRPSYRKVSKEEIRYPLIHPNDADTLDLWVESATMTAERRRPPRPSLDERPLVVSDPLLRGEEERVFRGINTAKRPERPREQDLPYGARGSMPKALVDEGRPPPPTVGRRPSALHATKQSNSVQFPSNVTGVRGAPPGPRGSEVDQEEDEKPPELPPKIFTPFAPVTQREIERRRGHAAGANRSTEQVSAPSKMPLPSATHGASLMQARPQQHGPFANGERSARGREPAKIAPDSQHLNAPTLGRRYGGIRRTSSSGDVNLPSQHARYHQARGDDSNEQPRAARRAPPELRTVRSTPLSSRKPSSSVLVPLPAHPAVYLQKGTARARTRNPDVPRDVSPDNPQRLPTPRNSAEEARPTLHPLQRAKDAKSPPAIPSTSVAARAQASVRVKESAAPRSVQVQMTASAATPHNARAVSYTARVQVIRPERERAAVAPMKERAMVQEHGQTSERDRRRERERAENPREVQYYGMADAFARQIALALAEPERTAPLPLDWDQFAAGGRWDYGTKPLVTRKVKERV